LHAFFARGDPGFDQLVPALRLAVIRRGLFGGGVQIGEQVASRDDVYDVVLQDVAESDRYANASSSAERVAHSVINRSTAVWRGQGIVQPLSGLGR
jgi:hypothetical protein